MRKLKLEHGSLWHCKITKQNWPSNSSENNVKDTKQVWFWTSGMWGVIGSSMEPQPVPCGPYPPHFFPHVLSPASRSPTSLQHFLNRKAQSQAYELLNCCGGQRWRPQECAWIKLIWDPPVFLSLDGSMPMGPFGFGKVSKPNARLYVVFENAPFPIKDQSLKTWH